MIILKMVIVIMMMAMKIGKLYVVDFDDTLVLTDAKIEIINKNLKLSSSEFVNYKHEIGDVLDYSDFRQKKLINPKLTGFFKTTFKNIIKDNSNIMILTARPQEHEEIIKKFLSSYISLNQLIIVGDAETPELKKREIEKKINNYREIKFYDDNQANINAVKSLKYQAKKSGTKLTTQLVKNETIFGL